MPIFHVSNGSASRLPAQSGFQGLEKGLQAFVEKNLETLFGVRFVASEFSTGGKHRGRIDTLGLDEDGSPVVIEYKELQNENVINQGLFYLDWLTDHKGDFERAAEKKIKPGLEFDWSSPRLILLAQGFNRYDQYAVNRISERIELWTYSMYGSNVFELRRLNVDLDGTETRKQAVAKAKDSSERSTEIHDLPHHQKAMSPETNELFLSFREKVLAFGSDVDERYLKQTINYRHSRNFCEVVPQKKDLVLGFDAEQLDDPRKALRDMKGVGSWTTGRWQLRLASPADLDYAVGLAEQSYNRTK
jgi:predicted transport protein